MKSYTQRCMQLKMRESIYIIVILLIGCTPEKPISLNINHKVNNNLEFNSFKDLDKEVSFNTDVIRVFNDTISGALEFCTCLLENGVLEIKISRNTGFVGEDLIIKANDSIFHMSYDHFGDVSSVEYQAFATRQELELNTKDFVENKILIGQVFFKEIGFCEEGRVPEFGVQLNGKFKCRIKNK
jgi:hypothetical protein